MSAGNSALGLFISPQMPAAARALGGQQEEGRVETNQVARGAVAGNKECCCYRCWWCCLGVARK